MTGRLQLQAYVVKCVFTCVWEGCNGFAAWSSELKLHMSEILCVTPVFCMCMHLKCRPPLRQAAACRLQTFDLSM